MSEEIVIIDSDDESPVEKTRVITLPSDSDSDDIQIEKIQINSEVEYVCHGLRSTLRRPRKRRDRNKRRENQSINETNIESLISSDSNQSRPNSVNTNNLKNELITPPKNPPNNQLFKNSPNFESPKESSSEPLPQTSNDSKSSSKDLDPIRSEISINSSLISSTEASLPAPTTAADSSEMLSNNISLIEEDPDLTENDFGVEDVILIENITIIEMNCNQNNQLISESDLLRSPTLLERSSTPISVKNIMSSEVIPNQMSSTSFQTSGVHQILNNEANTSNDSLNTTINTEILIEDTNESISESVPKEDQNYRKEFGIGTGGPIRRLPFEEIETNQMVVPVPQFYVCSYGCGQQFNNALLHYKHEKKELKDLKNLGVPTFKCIFNDCSFMGFTQTELMYHNSEHRGIYFCHQSDCLFRANSSDQIAVHKRSHRNAKKRVLRKGVYCDCGEPSCQPSRQTTNTSVIEPKL